MKKLILIIAIALFSVTSGYAYVDGVYVSTSSNVFNAKQSTRYVNTASIAYFVEANNCGLGQIKATFSDGTVEYQGALGGGSGTIVKSGRISKTGRNITQIFIEAACSGAGSSATSNWSW